MKCFSAIVCTCCKFHSDLPVISETWFGTQIDAGKWTLALLETDSLLFKNLLHSHFLRRKMNSPFLLPECCHYSPLLGTQKQWLSPGPAAQQSYMEFRPSGFCSESMGKTCGETLPWDWLAGLGRECTFRVTGWCIGTLQLQGPQLCGAQSKASLTWIYAQEWRIQGREE